jgi:hypothetical protein
LLHASLRQFLAVLPLRFASASPPSGCTGDFHPQNCRTCPTHRPLRAACGGGLRPVLTAAVRGATANPGRDEETAPPVEQRNCTGYQTFWQQTSSTRLADPNPVGPSPAGHPARSSRQRRHKGQDLGRDTPLRHRASTARRNAWNPIRETHRGQRSTDRAQQAGYMTPPDQLPPPPENPCPTGAVHT